MMDVPKEKSAGEVVIVSTTPGRGHGAEEVLVQLLRAWAAVDEPRPELHIAAPAGSRVILTARELGFNLIVLEGGHDTVSSHIRVAWRAAAKVPTGAVVHGWGIRALEAALVMAKRIRASRLVCTVHDSPFSSFHGKARRLLTRSMLSFCDGVVCVSEALRAEVFRLNPHCRTQVIYNGMEDLFLAGADVGKMVPSDRDGYIRVGFAGMYAGMKGFEIVARWIEQSPENIRWYLYGEICREFKPYLERVTRSGKGDVVYAGYCEPGEIYRDLDILVHASTDFEAFGLVLAEAACAGIPVVASRSGGPEEIVRDGITGFLFDTEVPEGGYARLIQLAESVELRRQMGQAARTDWEERFSSGRMAKSYRKFWLA